MSVLRYVWALPNTLLGCLVGPLVLASGGRITLIDGVIEMHGGVLSWLLRRCVPLPGGVAALTLGHVVVARDEMALRLTRGHERVHVRQYERWGPAFIPAYLLASVWAVLTGGSAYRDNYFECEACRLDRGSA